MITVASGTVNSVQRTEDRNRYLLSTPGAPKYCLSDDRWWAPRLTVWKPIIPSIILLLLWGSLEELEPILADIEQQVGYTFDMSSLYHWAHIQRQVTNHTHVSNQHNFNLHVSGLWYLEKTYKLHTERTKHRTSLCVKHYYFLFHKAEPCFRSFLIPTNVWHQPSARHRLPNTFLPCSLFLQHRENSRSVFTARLSCSSSSLPSHTTTSSTSSAQCCWSNAHPSHMLPACYSYNLEPFTLDLWSPVAINTGVQTVTLFDATVPL